MERGNQHHRAQQPLHTIIVGMLTTGLNAITCRTQCTRLDAWSSSAGSSCAQLAQDH
jgi:hypothetical protein